MSTSSLLWLLFPPEGKPSWIFGSMHIRDERVYQFCEQLYPLIQQADVYVGEMELDHAGKFQMPVYDLKAQIRPAAYEKMRKQLLKSFQVDVELYGHLHPLMIMSLITQNVLADEHQVSLDEHLWNYAKSNGKEVNGLESYEEQFTLLHSLDTKPLLRQLVQMAKSSSGIRKQTQRALAWYTKSDIQRLYQITKSSMHGLRKSIIYERNTVMAQRIFSFVKEKQYFIVIGAGHLGGKSGVLSLLKRSGWQMRPVRLKI